MALKSGAEYPGKLPGIVTFLHRKSAGEVSKKSSEMIDENNDLGYPENRYSGHLTFYMNNSPMKVITGREQGNRL